MPDLLSPGPLPAGRTISARSERASRDTDHGFEHDPQKLNKICDRPLVHPGNV